ncbi:MAG: right-handed parallel beta-helix repeat-containing protein [Flavicella sp.]
MAKHGDDTNIGSKEYPFKTISKAAQIALPGATITVHTGVYREWVRPAYGGQSHSNRITYQAADDSEVWIKGSERVQGWVQHKGPVWKLTLDNTFFGDFNPYKEIVSGDWLLDTFGKTLHLGEVYLNGEALYENNSITSILKAAPLDRALDTIASKYQWYCESDANQTVIYAHFKGMNPNEELVEINVRPAVFFPDKTGLNYITVRGFKMAHAATQWAPPTAEQTGLIGPNWSKGWIIEDNFITDSKCTGISIGKERASGHNAWTNLKVKHGTQTEREVVFKALQLGWSMETIGSHVIRNNTITNCEQTGICGHLGGISSEIYNNHIFNIYHKRQFFGYEIGGVKLHAAIDVLIEHNFIHDCFRGLWLDWQSQGTRVSKNIFYNNSKEDLFTEVNHGPMLVDNNVLLSEVSLLNASQGGAFVHNLLAGKIIMRPVPSRFTPYHFPHSTAVKGLMTILTGDDRYYNNIFTCNQEVAPPAKNANSFAYAGLDAYDGHPLPTDHWYKGNRPQDYAQHKLPVWIASNCYYNKAKPFNREVNAYEDRTFSPKIYLSYEEKQVFLHLDFGKGIEDMHTPLVTTQLLGDSFQSEAVFEHKDGSEIEVVDDMMGLQRNSANPKVGPFSVMKPGANSYKVFDLKHDVLLNSN